jgi:hypothetical protein
MPVGQGSLGFEECCTAGKLMGVREIKAPSQHNLKIKSITYRWSRAVNKTLSV